MTDLIANPPQIPESAPFSIEQRAWLNGFIAGLVSTGGSPEPRSPEEPEDDGAPWHDQTIPLDERMALAAQRPLNRKLMAAMGQQDCGQCGYNCEDYAEAIFSGVETKLNLCAPGGKPTARVVKKLHAEIMTGDRTPGATGPAARQESVATLISVTRLNNAASEKETNHVELSFDPGELSYEVGDSLGIHAPNDPILVDKLLARLNAQADTEISGGNGVTRTLGAVLSTALSLHPAPDDLFALLSEISTDPAERKMLSAMAEGDDPDGDLDTLDVLAALEKFPHLAPDPEALCAALDELQPRLYSISSSPKTVPGTVTLTVDAVRYEIGERTRKGVASCFLAERAAPDQQIRVYVQKAHGFALPDDDSTPVIMVGPGTGIAPFRAFLQERAARKADGPAWLFFGHQHEKTDFFYAAELKNFQEQGVLSRLSTAWSRDGDSRIYVQDRMREEGVDLFRWLNDGGHFYVCGDATRMAADVDCALRTIVAKHGNMSEESANGYVDNLIAQGRYQRDVY